MSKKRYFIYNSYFFIGVDVEWDPCFLGLRLGPVLSIGRWLIERYFVIRDLDMRHRDVAEDQCGMISSCAGAD
jgi:hypothetical protein